MLEGPPFVKDPELLSTASRAVVNLLPASSRHGKKNYQTQAKVFDKLLIFFNAFSKHKKI